MYSVTLVFPKYLSEFVLLLHSCGSFQNFAGHSDRVPFLHKKKKHEVRCEQRKYCVRCHSSVTLELTLLIPSFESITKTYRSAKLSKHKRLMQATVEHYSRAHMRLGRSRVHINFHNLALPFGLTTPILLPP